MVLFLEKEKSTDGQALLRDYTQAVLGKILSAKL
jgi:hypothetical protein